MRKLTKDSEIRELRAAAANHYRQAMSRWSEADAYYQRTYTIQKHKSVEAYKPPDAKNKVDVWTDQLCAIGRRVVVRPWKNTQKVAETVGVLKRWGELQLMAFERCGRVDPIWSATKHGNMYGKYVLKGPLYVPDRWPEKPYTLDLTDEEKAPLNDAYERRRSLAYPFTLRAVNPQNILDDPWSQDVEWVIETCQRRVADVKARWPKWEQASLPDWRTVTWTEYWSNDQYCAMAGNDVLTDGLEDNPYGFIPYQVGYGGLGYETADGAPEDLAEGLIYPSIGGFAASARLKTGMIAHMLRALAGERTITKEPGPDFAPATVPWEWGVIPDHYKPQVTYPTTLNPDVFRILPMIESDIDRATFSPVMEGRQPIGAAPQSGYDRAQMSAHDRVRLHRLVKSIERSLSNLLMLSGRIVRDIIREPVTLWSAERAQEAQSETAKPAYFDTDPVFEVRLDGKTPEERQRVLEIVSRLWKDGFLPWGVAIAEGTEYDPEQLRVQLYMEQTLSADPQIRAAVGALMLKLYGAGQYQQAIEQAQKSPAPPPPRNGGGNGGFEPLAAKLQRLDRMAKPAPLGSDAESTLEAGMGMPGVAVP